MKVQKKPVIIDAIQWTGNNFAEVAEFCGVLNVEIDANVNTLKIHTNEGIMDGVTGCWVMKANSASIGVHVWPVDKGYFEENYDIIEQ
jgi:hypothetical protein